MAKPTKHAPLICTIVSIVAVIGIIIGLIIKSPLVIILLLLPTAVYEAYRTEGRSTKTSSILLVVVLIIEAALIIFNVNFNLAEYLGVGEQYVGGYLVPLGDIKIVGPAMLAVLSVVLFVRTYGVYTKWLSVVLFITAFAIVYALDPSVFQDFLKFGIQEGTGRV